jgi:hypothetical protein
MKLMIQRGQYRIVYDFYRNELGDSGEKVFIDEISPSRKEVRVLPVGKGNAQLDAIFAATFLNFSSPGVDKIEFNRRFTERLKNISIIEIYRAIGYDRTIRRTRCCGD